MRAILTVVALTPKGEADLLAGLSRSRKNLGGQPLATSTDQEPTWNGGYVQQFLKDENI